MSLNTRFTTKRAIDPVDLKLLKKHVNQTSDDDNEILEEILNAAIDNIEEYTNKSLGERTIIAQWTRPQKGKYSLPYGPIRTVTTVERVFEDGTTETLTENEDYRIEGLDDKAIIMNSYWSSKDGALQTGLKVTYDAGFSLDYSTTTTKIPEPLRRAILKQAGYDYEYALCNPGSNYLNGLAENVQKEIYPFIDAKLMI